MSRSPRNADPVGRIGTVTGRVAPDTTGEVILFIRGGREAFFAHPYDGKEEIQVGDEALVIDYRPPRTLLVSKYETGNL